jgi:hypothetical protein
VIVAGGGGGTIDLGLGPIAGNGTVFLAKINAAGNTLWAKRFGVLNGSQTAAAVQTDGLGNIVIVGAFDSSIDFGGGALVSAGGTDVFVAKFSPAGTHLWSKGFGDVNATQGASSVAIDAAGNVIVTGSFLGTLDFGGPALVGTGMDNTQNIFLAKLDASGNHLWSKSFGDGAQQTGLAVAVGPGGSVLLTGGIAGSTNFGGGALVASGSRDAFVARFDTNGSHLKSQIFGGLDDQFGQALAPDGAGGVLVTGFFYGTIDFGNGLLTSAGNSDTFLARLPP